MSDNPTQRPTSFRGGLRWQSAVGCANVSWPLTALVLHNDHLQFRPSWPWVGKLMPNISRPYEDIVAAERVQGSLLGSPGVRVVTSDTSAPLIFWSFRPGAVLDALEMRGVRVDRRRHKVGPLGL